jgi:hypothetical protein
MKIKSGATLSKRERKRGREREREREREIEIDRENTIKRMSFFCLFTR